MTTLVVVHGAFGGGWEWEPVADTLRDQGTQVVTPTLSGLGARFEVDPATVGLETHVADIVAAVDELTDQGTVVLCLASYAGVPGTVAASRLPGRVARLVYLDALVPHDGEAAVDLLPPTPAAAIREGLRAHGHAHRVPVPELVLPPVGSAPEDVRRLFVSRLRPQPVRTFTDPARFEDVPVPATFVRCTRGTLGDQDPIVPMVRRARDLGWDLRELAATHDPHLSEPAAVVALLAGLLSDPADGRRTGAAGTDA